MKIAPWFKGELIGTFILVFFGCGSVATFVALQAPSGVFQVAIVWGLGLATAIFVSGKQSGAHLNPAITLAAAVLGIFPRKRVAGYMAAQVLGAFLAAAAVYGVFGGAIGAYESAQGVLRGQPGSEATAMVFGEFYPNPGGHPLTETKRATVSQARAFFAEFIGTGLLALIVFGLLDRRNDKGAGRLTPLAIGLALAVLVAVFGPITMACFNPARDFGPRLFSALSGWGGVPFTTNGLGWLTVYIISPFLGALAGAWLAQWLFREAIPMSPMSPTGPREGVGAGGGGRRPGGGRRGGGGSEGRGWSDRGRGGMRRGDRPPEPPRPPREGPRETP